MIMDADAHHAVAILRYKIINPTKQLLNPIGFLVRSICLLDLPGCDKDPFEIQVHLFEIQAHLLKYRCILLKLNYFGQVKTSVSLARWNLGKWKKMKCSTTEVVESEFGLTNQSLSCHCRPLWC